MAARTAPKHKLTAADRRKGAQARAAAARNSQRMNVGAGGIDYVMVKITNGATRTITPKNGTSRIIINQKGALQDGRKKGAAGQRAQG